MRNLNAFYAMEVLNGRINGSSNEVERNKNGYKNASYTKKVAGRSKISAQCQKLNIKGNMIVVNGAKEPKRIKDGKQIKAIYDPFNSEIDDVFGFMIADKVEKNKEEYEKVDEETKKLFKKEKEKYTMNITKKRKSRLQMNALINVSNNRVEWEWSVASSTTDSMPYQQEIYSGVHTSILNLDIDRVGKYVISDNPSEHRDYGVQEAKALGVRDLTNEEKLDRIKHVLEGIEHLSISSNQTNHLTDTKPKFVILADYKWGNNAFQGVLKDGRLDMDMLEECINQNEKYRISNIYIGINKFFDDRYNTIKQELEETFKETDYIKVSDVKTAFENYINELEDNMK